MKKTRAGTILWWSIFVLFSAGTAGLQAAARKIEWFSDWYESRIYIRLVETVGIFMGIFPFSVGEILISVAGAGLIAVLIWMIAGLFRRDGRRRQRVIRGVKIWGMTGAAALFLYTAQCGVNYFRTPFSEEADYTIEKSSPEELEALCRSLAEEINQAAEQISVGENGLYEKPENLPELAKEAMVRLGTEYDCFAGNYPRPKWIFHSVVFSYQYITGIYSPFTIEANVNRDMPDMEQGAVMCHELSHLRGFMREDEANFIAYLACRESGNADLQYSGAMFAFTYCMNALYRESGSELYTEIYRLLTPQAVTDRQYSSRWWKQYDTPVKEAADRVNNTYLQVNAQSDGTKSYGRMVDLMLADYRSREK